MENIPSKSLLNDVFQILDSRIQYIEYQLSKLSKQSLHANQSKTLPETDSIFSIEMVFKQIELHNRSLKLLILLEETVKISVADNTGENIKDIKQIHKDTTRLTQACEKGPIKICKSTTCRKWQ